MRIPDRDIDTIQTDIQEAVWVQANEEDWTEDEAIFLSDELCEQVRELLSVEFERPHHY